MKIKLTFVPRRADSATALEISGSILTVGGEDYDLSDVPDGATVERRAPAGALENPDLCRVSRNGDEYECLMRLNFGPNAPRETRFPAPIILENHNGPVELPLYDIEKEVTE